MYKSELAKQGANSFSLIDEKNIFQFKEVFLRKYHIDDQYLS